MHEEYDVLDMWSTDLPKIPPEKAVKQLGIVTLMFIAFGFLLYKVAPESPAIPREYPYSGLVKELGGLEENKVMFPISVARHSLKMPSLPRQGKNR